MRVRVAVLGKKEGVCVSMTVQRRTEEEGIWSISEALDSTARASFLIWKCLSSAWLLGLGGVKR